MSAFTPYPAGTYLVAVTASSVSQALPARPTTVHLFNSSGNTVYIEVGAAATIPAGSPGSMPLAAGARLFLEKGYATNLQMIAGVAGPSNVFVTIGAGDTIG